MGQLRGLSQIAVAQGQVKHLQVLGEGNDQKHTGISNLQSVRYGVKLLREHWGNQREYDFEDAKVHAVTGLNDDVYSGVIKGCLHKP